MRGRYSFAVIGVGLILLTLWLGMFPNGGVHGLNSDDYAQKAWAFDVERGGWALQTRPEDPYFRPLHGLLTPNLVNAVPAHELPLRIAWAGVHVVNALLLGALAYRLTQSPLAFVGAAGLFLMPLIAYEVLLWHAASVPYLSASLALLVALHAALSAGRRPWYWGISAFCLLLVPLFHEGLAHLVVLFPVVAWVAFSESSAEIRWRNVRRMAVFTGLALLAYGLYMKLVLSHSWQVTARGGWVTSPYEMLRVRLPEVFYQFVRDILRRRVVDILVGHAVSLGWQTWTASVWGVALLIGWVGLAGGFIATAPLPVHSRRYRALALVGVAWAILSFSPILLVKMQWVDIRMLYLPWAGLALVVGAVLGALPRRGLARLGLVTLAGWTLVNALGMAGTTRAYQARWEMDQRQLAALQAVVPALPPVSPVWLWPVAVDRHSLDVPNVGALDGYFVSVYEISWALKAPFRWRIVVGMCGSSRTISTIRGM